MSSLVEAVPHISVLIPIFNFDITMLIQAFSAEVDKNILHEKVEIICVDDGSTDLLTKNINKQIIGNMKGLNINYIELNENRGRSAVRNYLMDQAKGVYLLFVDSDGLPDNQNFLGRYLTYAMEGKFDVVCGGRSYQTRLLMDTSFDFYVYFSSKTEVKPPEVRNLCPWRYLLTSNIMVRRSVALSCPIDQSFIGYGYEDTEWAIRLQKKYAILHIDNTVSHLGLIKKAEVFDRMRGSNLNYYLLSQMHPEFFRESPIYKFVIILQRFPGRILSFMEKRAYEGYSLTESAALSYFFLQLSKAILLATKASNEPIGRN